MLSCPASWHKTCRLRQSGSRHCLFCWRRRSWRGGLLSGDVPLSAGSERIVHFTHCGKEKRCWGFLAGKLEAKVSKKREGIPYSYLRKPELLFWEAHWPLRHSDCNTIHSGRIDCCQGRELVFVEHKVWQQRFLTQILHLALSLTFEMPASMIVTYE